MAAEWQCDGSGSAGIEGGRSVRRDARLQLLRPVMSGRWHEALKFVEPSQDNVLGIRHRHDELNQ